MGRNKIPIERIKNDKIRNSTFMKRKAGLVKKAMELSILCDCEIALVVISPSNKLNLYCSSDLDSILKYLSSKSGTHHYLTNSDYQKYFGGSGSVMDDSLSTDITLPISSFASSSAAATTTTTTTTTAAAAVSSIQPSLPTPSTITTTSTLASSLSSSSSSSVSQGPSINSPNTLFSQSYPLNILSTGTTTTTTESHHHHHHHRHRSHRGTHPPQQQQQQQPSGSSSFSSSPSSSPQMTSDSLISQIKLENIHSIINSNPLGQYQQQEQDSQHAQPPPFPMMAPSSSSRGNSGNSGRPGGINDIDPLSQSRFVIDRSGGFLMKPSGLLQSISDAQTPRQQQQQQQQQQRYSDEQLPIFLPSLSMSNCGQQSLPPSITSQINHNDVIQQQGVGRNGILMTSSGAEHVMVNLPPPVPLRRQSGSMTSQMTSQHTSFLGEAESNSIKNGSGVNPIQDNNRLCGNDVTSAEVPALNISSLSSILTSSGVSPPLSAHFPMTSSQPNTSSSSSVTFSDPKIGVTANSACNSSSSSSAIASRNSNSQNLPNSHNSTGPGMIHNASSSNSSNLTSVVNNINNDNVNKNINPESILSMNVNHFGQNNNNNSINNINFNNNNNNNNTNNNDNNNNGQFNGSWNPIYNDQVFLPPLEKKVKKE